MAFQDFFINGSKAASLTIAGKAVKDLWINGKQVKQAAAARNLTIQASINRFADDDLTLAASGDITPEFTIKCYSASGSDLGSYTFKQAMTSSTRTSLISLMKAAGIDVDSMKTAGSRFEFTDVKQWSTNDVYIKLSGSTSDCFSTYGSLDETFKGANADWSMAYFFQNNSTIQAAGLTFEGKYVTDTSFRFMAMFQNCSSMNSHETTDENGVKHRMSINAGGMAACTQMFENCKGLHSLLIELPATSVQTSAYSLMFNGCTGILGSSFKLPATSVTDNCYINMFANGCGVADIHFPASLKTDSTFNSMEGSPTFGGYQAYAVFDL